MNDYPHDRSDCPQCETPFDQNGEPRTRPGWGASEVAVLQARAADLERQVEGLAEKILAKRTPDYQGGGMRIEGANMAYETAAHIVRSALSGSPPREFVPREELEKVQHCGSADPIMGCDCNRCLVRNFQSEHQAKLAACDERDAALKSAAAMRDVLAEIQRARGDGKRWSRAVLAVEGLDLSDAGRGALLAPEVAKVKALVEQAYDTDPVEGPHDGAVNRRLLLREALALIEAATR